MASTTAWLGRLACFRLLAVGLVVAVLNGVWSTTAIAALALSDELAQALPTTDASSLSLPLIGLQPGDLALIVNDADPASVEIGRYYASRRGIAADRVVHVSFPAGQVAMSAVDFQRVQAVLQARVPASVQAYALAWTL